MGDPDSRLEPTASVAEATPEPEPVVDAPPARPYHRGHKRRLKRRRAHRRVNPEAATTTATVAPSEPVVSRVDAEDAHRQFLAAQLEYLDLVGDDSDEASRLRTQYKRLVRKATHAQRCGPDCVQVEIDVPAAASNPHGHDFFRLGTRQFPPGRYTVWACEARELARMIDQNRCVDDGRLREHTRVMSAGAIRAQQIRAEN